MTFLGFSLSPSQQWPPELAPLLPYLKSMSELKTLLFVLDACTWAQLEPVPLTLNQIQRGTGLARQSAVTGLKLALEHGLLERDRAGLTFAYHPRLAESAAARLQCVCTMNHKQLQTMGQTQSLQSKKGAQYHQLYRLLVEEFCVAAAVAENILLTHDLDTVQQHIEYARVEIERGGIRRRAGYIVARIRDNWGPPEEAETPSAPHQRRDTGAGKRRPAQKSQRWYTDEEFDTYFEHPPDPDAAAEEAGSADEPADREETNPHDRAST